MRKMLLSAAATVAMMSTAHADQLTLGESTPGVGSYDFYANPPASLSWGSPGIGGSTAFFGGDQGSYTFGIFGPNGAGPLVGGNFATDAFQPLTVTLADGDTFNATASWQTVKDHSDFPDLIGNLAIASSAGDAAWLGSFPAGGTADIDAVLTFKPGTGSDTKLDDLASMAGAAEWFTVSTAEIVPRPGPVDEPATLLMLGMAFLGLGWLYRRPVDRVS